MDTDNRLSRLGGNIRDAQDSLDAAIREAEAILDDNGDIDAQESDWPVLSALVDALHAARAVLAPLPGEELAKAIEAADTYLDDMADRADGISL
jgi:hypothetical protein